ncbi:hypothetical protein LEP1GSC165_0059 [Leptospira santarosai str. CBC523]|nr:hypothetical protein [Leptospira santarosai]EMO12489.1 hypothetical protein LEP1GSC165_0059 [Leptospira santarosai str. CBC523]
MRKVDKFIEAFINERLRAGDSPEQIEKTLNVVNHFLSNGLFAWYKSSGSMDCVVSLNKFADAIESHNKSNLHPEGLKADAK